MTTGTKCFNLQSTVALQLIERSIIEEDDHFRSPVDDEGYQMNIERDVQLDSED